MKKPMVVPGLRETAASRVPALAEASGAGITKR